MRARFAPRMRLSAVLATIALAGVLAACGGDDASGTTRRDGGGGTPGTDRGPRPDGAPPPPPPVDLGVDGGGACVPTIEICGDRIDQNCDGRETPCGDTDMDGINACRTGDDLTRCDCDDARADVRPPFGTLPGAPELCDGRDNDCNGRIDESAACCTACASLGASRDRADVCTPEGVCDCSTAPGLEPCGPGQTCCGTGCVDLNTDFANCGACGAQCTPQADRCTARSCTCGTGPACDFVTMCTSGACG